MYGSDVLQRERETSTVKYDCVCVCVYVCEWVGVQRVRENNQSGTHTETYGTTLPHYITDSR